MCLKCGNLCVRSRINEWPLAGAANRTVLLAADRDSVFDTNYQSAHLLLRLSMTAGCAALPD